MKPEHPGNDNPNRSNREVDVFTALLAILDFVDNEMPKLGSIAELRTTLVIWRQTHGWGKLTDSIGIAQLAKQTATDAKAIQRALSGKRPGGRKDRPLAEKIGIVRHQQGLDAAGDLARTRYTWPVNERVRAKLEKAVQNESGSKRGGEVQVTPTPGVQVTPAGGSKIAPTQSCTLNLIKESSSSEAASAVQEPMTTTETIDDDPPVSEENKTEVPVVTTVPLATSNPEDLEALVETAREQLQKTRAEELSFAGAISSETLAQTRRPDRAITVQILEEFRNYGYDVFQDWLKDTVARKVAQKATPPRYGIYLSDARNEAENVALKRQAEEKHRIDAEIARERWQAAEAQAAAEAVRIMNTPIPALEALAKIQTRVPALPSPLKARLERTGELISPNELERQARNWRRCPECHKGILGNALDRDLRFCACPAGEEAQHPTMGSGLTKPAGERFHKGADYPAREIARVHADAKSLLVAACYSRGLMFAGDSLERSTISDDGVTLAIMLETRDTLAVRPDDVEQALARIQWKRAVQIVKPDLVKIPEPTGKPAPAAKPEAAVPHRPPITQADVDRELAKRWPPRMEPGLAGPVNRSMAAAAGSLL